VLQPHPDAVPGRKAADHEQAHAAGDAHIYHRRMV
jgi:hypothetical protein